MRTSVHRQREVARLHFSTPARSSKSIGQAVGLSPTFVTVLRRKLRESGMAWEQLQQLEDEEWISTLDTADRISRKCKPEPNWAWVHQERQRPHSTLKSIWSGWHALHADCISYREFSARYALWKKNPKTAERRAEARADARGDTPAIDDAYGVGSVQRPRLPSPFTHAEVVQAVLAEQFDDSQQASAKVFRNSAASWCRALNVSVDDPAALTLGDAFSEALQRYQDHLQRNHPDNPRAGKNVRTAASKINKAYLALLANQELPADFNEAFKLAMDRCNLKPAELNKIIKSRFMQHRPNWYGAQLWQFYDGTAGPGKSWHGDSREILTHCEEILGLRTGSFVSRAYPTVRPILNGAPTEIGYRRARSEQAGERYALKRLPERIARIFNDYTEWRYKSVVLVQGKPLAVEPRSLWTSNATVKIHRTELLRYLGWLCLPAPDRPLIELTAQAQRHVGAGLQVAELSMAHLMDLGLIWRFIEYRKARQHNHALTQSHATILMVVNCFYSMPYGYLVAHPQLATEFGFEPPASIEAWQASMEVQHQRTVKMISTIKRIVGDTKQRSPDEPLRHLLDHEAPFELLLTMLEEMEKQPPLRANQQTWSVWARDVAMFRMQAEVPLRARNLADLSIGKHLTRDPDTKLWQVHISTAELKNHFSPHAQDIYRTYSPVASAAIDRYVEEARPFLVGHVESNYFFLGPACGRRASSSFLEKQGFRLSTEALADATAKYLRRYFGQGQGLNFFRHLIATSILKDNPTAVEVAAAVLNNSPDSVRKNYRHLTQADGLRLARTWFQQQEARRTRGRTEGPGGADEI
jgi:hypothetical protein